MPEIDFSLLGRPADVAGHFQQGFTATGAETYGRPVVKLGGEGNDPAVDLLRNGNALAAPEYLKGDPRFPAYMEAERLARQNRLGGHGTNTETPSQYRHKNGPWQGAEPGQYGNGDAVFGDEPTPFQGLRPEVEQAYLAIANDPKSTGADFVAFGKANGFEPDPADIDRFLTARAKGAPTDQRVRYKDAPRILTDPGDGKFGTTARGFGDPFNMIDELGGVVDTLGGSGGRENIWNSERRFGDVLWNNIDQNRSILAHDEATHPYYRMGGQLAGGLVVPVAGEARTIGQLAKIGAVEGGLAGFGAGEGDIQQRLPNAAVGAGLGAAGGAVLGAAGAGIAKGYRMVRGRMLPAAEGSAAEQAARETSVPSPPPGYVMDSASPRSAAMMMDEPAIVSGPSPRTRDVIDVASVPPPPAGYTLEQPFGITRKAGQPLDGSDIAKLGETVEPSSVLPRPASQVDTMEEAALANPGPFKLVDAPDEFGELAVRRIGRGNRWHRQGARIS